MCVLQMSLLTHILFICRSQIPPFSPQHHGHLSFLLSFLFFILSLPRSASPMTHGLLATKAFSAKNKRPSHDKHKIWFNYRNLPEELGVWARIQGPGTWGGDLSDRRRPVGAAPASRSRRVYDRTDCLVPKVLKDQVSLLSGQVKL